VSRPGPSSPTSTRKASSTINREAASSDRFRQGVTSSTMAPVTALTGSNETSKPWRSAKWSRFSPTVSPSRAGRPRVANLKARDPEIAEGAYGETVSRRND
jgi:hypothetical protein